MNEDKMRELIQGSLLKTSDEFTDKLMNKVELQSITKKTRVVFLSAFLASFILFILVWQLDTRISLFDQQVNIAPKTIWVLASLSIFIILNRLMNLKDAFLKTQ